MNPRGILRDAPTYPQHTQPPIDPPDEDEEELPDDNDEHDEDWDEDADQAAAYNDYLRDLEA